MELYFKNSEGQLQETTLCQVLSNAFKKAGLKIENGCFSDENHMWLGIIQENKKPAQVTTNITFNNDGNTITGLNVYETPIKRIIDEDNSRQII